MKPSDRDVEDIDIWRLGAIAMLVGEKGELRRRYAYLLAAAALRAADDVDTANQVQAKGLACQVAPLRVT